MGGQHWTTWREARAIAVGMLLLGVTAPGRQVSAGVHYMYFKQPVPLQIDPSRVVVFDLAIHDRAVGRVAGVPQRLSRFGVRGEDITPGTIRGMSYIRMPGGPAPSVNDVREWVRNTAGRSPSLFVTPVFLNERGMPQTVTQDVIVRFHENVEPAQAEALLRRFLPGATILDRNWTGLNGMYRLRSGMRDGFEVLEAANGLASHPDVRFAEPDMVMAAVRHVIPNDPRFPEQWSYDNTGQSGGTPNRDMDGPEAWDVTTGSDSIIVAILDDGIDQDHPDIHQLPGRDFTGNNSGGDHANECDRHGTSVAGCVAAIMNNGVGGTGIAPGVMVISAKDFLAHVPCTNAGDVTSSWTVSALDWAEKMGARVTNTSHSMFVSSAITDKYEQTRSNGMVHFAAAGNDGGTVIGYPGNLPSVNAIASIQRTGALAFDSTHGPDTAFAAPGVDIWTTDRAGADGYTPSDEVELSGTSFASPHAAGVAALVLSTDSTLTPDGAEIVLRDSAMDLGTPGFDTQYGFGLVKAAAAMLEASQSGRTCADARLLECNDVALFDNTLNDASPTPPMSCGDGGNPVGATWFQFTATAPSAEVSTCGSVAPDSTISVYTGDCGSLMEIACSEDGGCDGSGNSRVCVSGLTVGETYSIQVASRSAADRGPYRLELHCACRGACCAPPPFESCARVREEQCADREGGFGGPGTECTGDANTSGLDDGCEQLVYTAGQLPVAQEGVIASNLESGDSIPNVVVADDFLSDGRPIEMIRWWGSRINPSVSPDGWLVSFHEPLTVPGTTSTPLAVYFCGLIDGAVSTRPVPFPVCAGDGIEEYEVSLSDCCLLSARADSRSGMTPGGAVAFDAEECAAYDMGIQATVYHSYVSDGGGGCTEIVGGVQADGDYWGWLSTSVDNGARSAVSSQLTLNGPDREYGPWKAVVPDCGSVNMSFELLTTRPSGLVETGVWTNGPPGGAQFLASQSGGELAYYMTVDDFELAAGETIDRIVFTNEDEVAFPWSGAVRIEVYPDAGGAPNVSGGAAVTWIVPDDGGTARRTFIGSLVDPPPRDVVRYELDGLNLNLGPGVWWLGVAAAGLPGTTGQSNWATSRGSEDPLAYGSEAHFRFPDGGFPNFVPWSTMLPGDSMFDTSFRMGTARIPDCNCNGIDDRSDIDQAASLDCNGNDIPDECERDCNGTGRPDDCDLADLTSPDCQMNAIPDECDVLYGTSEDADGNGVPDECDCPSDSAQPEPQPIDKNRYISFVPGNTGRRVALRVTLVDLDGFEAFNGEVRWIGEPFAAPDVEVGATLMVAPLTCTPHFMDWGAVGTLHAYGDGIVPNSRYEIQVVHENCSEALDDPASYSPGYAVSTVTNWGKIMPPLDQPVSFQDILQVVNAFKQKPGVPNKARTQLWPTVPDPNVGIQFQDIQACVGGFQQKPYPFDGPVACP